MHTPQLIKITNEVNNRSLSVLPDGQNKVLRTLTICVNSYNKIAIRFEINNDK